MKILITGGSGLLGEYLNIELSQKHQILTLYNSSFGNCKDFDSAKLDITNQSSLQNVFNDYKPNVVITRLLFPILFYQIIFHLKMFTR